MTRKIRKFRLELEDNEHWGRLSPKQREVMALVHPARGPALSIPQMALVLGWPEGTIKSRIFRARRRLEGWREHPPLALEAFDATV